MCDNSHTSGDHSGSDIDDWQFPTSEVGTTFHDSRVKTIQLTQVFITQELRKELEEEFTADQKAKVWADAAGVVQRHHEQLIARWNVEMDTLLVYVSEHNHFSRQNVGD